MALDVIDRDRHGQLVQSNTIGDCFRASMSVILDVPNGEHLPTARADDRPHGWWFDWHSFLGQFGIALHHASAKGPIWKPYRWIASVTSKNYDDTTHAIVMEGSQVLFDPSARRRYRRGIRLSGLAGVVVGGYWLEVADVKKLGGLDQFRRFHA